MGRTSDVEYKMRMTQELKEKIAESAQTHNRSMNADIVARLENSFSTATLSNASTEELMAELLKRMGKNSLTIQGIESIS